MSTASRLLGTENRQGDAFAIRQGTPLTWSQTEGTERFYVILNNG